MRLSAMICLGVAITIAAVTGCATDAGSGSGTLQIPLVQSDGAGTLFRLSAQFAISDGQTTLTVDGNVDAPSVTLSLPPAPYTIKILDGWRLERSVQGQPFEPVTAELGSPNPQFALIEPRGSATVTFFFLLDLGTQGDLTVTFGIFPLRARLLATLRATDATGTLAGYVEHPATFIISYSFSVEAIQFVPPRAHEVISSFNELRFVDDPLGLFASTGSASGGFLDYRVEVEPDDSQVFRLNYAAPLGAALQSLDASAIPLAPKVPIDELGVPSDPGRVGGSVSAAFTLSAGDLGSMSGTVDLQFMPRS